MGLSVKIPGSCGELVQGMIDDIPFLVTCPISMYTKASITKYFLIYHIKLVWHAIKRLIIWALNLMQNFV